MLEDLILGIGAIVIILVIIYLDYKENKSNNVNYTADDVNEKNCEVKDER